MPERLPLELTWLYQANEEILETSYWYYRDVDIEANTAQLLCVDLASWALGKAGNFANIFPTNCKLWGVSARSPIFFNAGPARYDIPLSNLGQVDDYAATDQVTMRVDLIGQNADEEPIKNGLILSGVPLESINCNLISSTQQTLVNNELANFMPFTIALSSGTVTLGIRHAPIGGAVTFYPCTSRSLNSMLGTDITRRGNRPQHQNPRTGTP